MHVSLTTNANLFQWTTEMKKKYLLDTNICIFCMRGKFEMNRKIALAGIDNCHLSEISVAELSSNIRTRNALFALWRPEPASQSVEEDGVDYAPPA